MLASDTLAVRLLTAEVMKKPVAGRPLGLVLIILVGTLAGWGSEKTPVRHLRSYLLPEQEGIGVQRVDLYLHNIF